MINYDTNTEVKILSNILDITEEFKTIEEWINFRKFVKRRYDILTKSNLKLDNLIKILWRKENADKKI